MIDISQEQIIDLLKSSPNFKFTIQDIVHSLGLRKQRVYKSMKSLEKMDCIKKEKGCWCYVSEGKD